MNSEINYRAVWEIFYFLNRIITGTNFIEHHKESCVCMCRMSAKQGANERKLRGGSIEKVIKVNPTLTWELKEPFERYRTN